MVDTRVVPDFTEDRLEKDEISEIVQGISLRA